MKYAALVYHDPDRLDAVSDADIKAVNGGCGEWVGELKRNGQYVFSGGLQGVTTASTVRSRAGHLSISDGPFAETKEILGGLTVFEARDLNEALQIAANMPAARIGSVEVRPLWEADSHLTDPLDIRIAETLGGVTQGELMHAPQP